MQKISENPPIEIRCIQRNFSISQPYIEFISINVLQLHCNGALPRLQVVHIAGTMSGQVGVAILKSRDLVLPIKGSVSVKVAFVSHNRGRILDYLPFVQAHCILDE